MFETKWNYDTCKEEAKKYKTRGEFSKGNVSAYQVARKNKWLDEYDWFADKPKRDYWNYDTCKEEAKKYKTRNEFSKGNGSAYQVALKNKWLDEFFPKQTLREFVEAYITDLITS